MRNIIYILTILIYSFLCSGQASIPVKVIEKRKAIYNTNSGNKGKFLAVNNGTCINVYNTGLFDLSYSINISTSSIDFSDFSDLLICGDTEGQVHLYQGEALIRKFQAHPLKITKVKLNKSNNLIATTSIDSTIKIWSLGKNELVAKLKYQTGLITDFQFTMDNLHLISSTSIGEVVVWDYKKDTIISTLKSHKKIARSIAISPDGKTFASCGDDGKIIIYPNYNEYYELTKTHNNNMVVDIEFLNKDFILSIGHDHKLIMNNINLLKENKKKINYFYPIEIIKQSGDKYLNDIEISNNLNFIAISTLGNGVIFKEYFNSYPQHELTLSVGGHTKIVKGPQEFRVFLANYCQIKGAITNYEAIKNAWIVDTYNDNKTEIEINERGSFSTEAELPAAENKFNLIIENVDINLLQLKFEFKIIK